MLWYLIFQAFCEKFKNLKWAKCFDVEKAKRFVFVHLEVRGEMVTLRKVEIWKAKYCRGQIFR